MNVSMSLNEYFAMNLLFFLVLIITAGNLAISAISYLSQYKLLNELKKALEEPKPYTAESIGFTPREEDSADDYGSSNIDLYGIKQPYKIVEEMSQIESLARQIEGNSDQTANYDLIDIINAKKAEEGAEA